MNSTSYNLYNDCFQRLEDCSASGVQRPFLYLLEKILSDASVLQFNQVKVPAFRSLDMHSVSQQPSTSVGLDEAVGTQPGFRDFQSSPLGVRLTNALASLPDQERVVVQAYLFSPNFDAIAMQLGMSRGDAQSLFWSALATLRMIKTHHNEVSTGLTRRRLSLVRAIPISDEAA